MGGSLRGRRIDTVPGRELRPTADRVREALFDILGPRVIGARFLDAYAGTGAIGIEAISRGAAMAAFVEAGEVAGEVLERNLRLVAEVGCEVAVMRRDLQHALAELESRHVAFDIVYLDPPYGGGELDRALRLIGRSTVLAGGAVVIGEHASGESPPRNSVLRSSRTSIYGRAALTFYTGLEERRDR